MTLIIFSLNEILILFRTRRDSYWWVTFLNIIGSILSSAGQALSGFNPVDRRPAKKFYHTCDNICEYRINFFQSQMLFPVILAVYDTFQVDL